MSSSGNSRILVVLDTDGIVQQQSVTPSSVWVIVSSPDSIDCGPGDEVLVTAAAGTALDWMIVPLNPLASVILGTFSSSTAALAKPQLQRRATRIAVPMPGTPPFEAKTERVTHVFWRTAVLDADAFPVAIEWGIAVGGGRSRRSNDLTWKTTVVNVV